MATKQKKKPGGLLLGIFIGLVLGLGIAIVVAMFVSKSASKVSSKYSPVEKAPERDPTKPLPDPNKALYAQTGSGNVTPDKPDAADSGSQTKPAAKTKPRKAVKPKSKDDAEARRREWRYFLQAGAYLNLDEAENVRAQLAFMGQETSISKRWTAQGTMHRVRTGPYSDVDEMNQVRRQLIQSGYTPTVVRFQINKDKKKP